MQNNLKKVMLIDDNEIDLKVNSKILSLTGFFNEIILCQSGDESLAYLRRRLNTPDKLPDLILLDIQMPEMNGFEFLEHYKKLPGNFMSRCKVVMLSSTLDFGDIKRAEANVHVVKLLKKPLHTTDLADIFNSFAGQYT